MERLEQEMEVHQTINIKLTDFCWLNPREVSVHCQRRFGEDLQQQTMHQRVHVPSPPEVSLIAREPSLE